MIHIPPTDEERCWTAVRSTVALRSIKRYFIGHYSPAGNHFFAYSIKDTIIDWLDPKPITYQKQEDRWISFDGYLPK